MDERPIEGVKCINPQNKPAHVAKKGWTIHHACAQSARAESGCAERAVYLGARCAILPAHVLEDSSMNRAAMRALREQAAALNDMLALLQKRMRITEFYGQRGQTARKSFRSIKP